MICINITIRLQYIFINNHLFDCNQLCGSLTVSTGYIYGCDDSLHCNMICIWIVFTAYSVIHYTCNIPCAMCYRRDWGSVRCMWQTTSGTRTAVRSWGTGWGQPMTTWPPAPTSALTGTVYRPRTTRFRWELCSRSCRFGKGQFSVCSSFEKFLCIQQHDCK